MNKGTNLFIFFLLLVAIINPVSAGLFDFLDGDLIPDFNPQEGSFEVLEPLNNSVTARNFSIIVKAPAESNVTMKISGASEVRLDKVSDSRFKAYSGLIPEGPNQIEVSAEAENFEQSRVLNINASKNRSQEREYNVGIHPGAVSASGIASASSSNATVTNYGSQGITITGRFSKAEVEALKNDPAVDYVERNGMASVVSHSSSSQLVPWGVDSVEADNAIHDGKTGEGVDVAVIDSGIDADHPDLVGNLGEGEAVVSCSGCVERWGDDAGHGTHVAGTIAASNNDRYVLGVAPDARLHSVKVLYSNGWGSYSDIAEGIKWAADQNYDIISMSIGGSSSFTLRESISYARDQGSVLVAAAGNTGPCSNCVLYPAKYGGVMGVSATKEGGGLADFSSTGTSVDIAAPGKSINSTFNDGGTQVYSGTSMAAPHVSGAAALLLSENPGLTATEVREKLKNAAKDTDLGPNEEGAGILNVENLLNVSSIDRNIELGGLNSRVLSKTEAEISVEIRSLSGIDSGQIKFYYWRKGDRSETQQEVIRNFDGPGSYQETLTGLEGNESYVFKAEAASGNVTASTGKQNFRTEALEEHVITIEGVGEASTQYNLEVESSLSKSTEYSASINSGDKVDGTESSGGVSPGGRDSYSFRGRLVRFIDDGNVSVMIDGTKIDVSDRVKNHSITFQGISDNSFSYSMNTTGTIGGEDFLNGRLEGGDSIDGNQLTGGLVKGRDSYEFIGNITGISSDGPLVVYKDTKTFFLNKNSLSVNMKDVSEINSSSVRFKAELSGLGERKRVEAGFEYWPEGQISNKIKTEKAIIEELGTYGREVTGLGEGVYKVRPVATTSGGEQVNGSVYEFSLNSSEDQNQSLVIHYKMENEDMLSDNSENSISANVKGAKITEGVSQKGLKFDGNDDTVVSTKSQKLNTDSLTFSTWFRMPKTPNCNSGNNWRSFARKGRLANTQSGWDVVLEEGGDLAFDVSGTRWWPKNRAQRILGYPLDQWNHYVFTYKKENGRMAVYKNGRLVDEKFRSAEGIKSNNQGFKISGGNNEGCPSGAGHVPGKLDEVKLFSKALNKSRIHQLYSEGAEGIPEKHNLTVQVTNGTSPVSKASFNISTSGKVVDKGETDDSGSESLYLSKGGYEVSVSSNQNVREKEITLSSKQILTFDLESEKEQKDPSVETLDPVEGRSSVLLQGNISETGGETLEAGFRYQRDYSGESGFEDGFEDGSLGEDWFKLDADSWQGTSVTESKGTLLIKSNGADTWKGDDEYASAYRKDIKGDWNVTATVNSIGSADDWEKTGIMARNDMNQTGLSRGYVFLTVTPGNGYSLQWDSNGDGYLDKGITQGSKVMPVKLRLERNGDSYTGMFKGATDDSWTEIGSVSPSSPKEEQDIGLSHTSHSSELASTSFESFRIERQGNVPELGTIDTTQARNGKVIERDGNYVLKSSGIDVWQQNDDYVAAYRKGVEGDAVASTKVLSQEQTHEWAKSGIMIANNIEKPGSSVGDIIFSTTPGNGYALQWDSDGDGYIDKSSHRGSVNYPTKLKLKKDGNKFVAEYSEKGEYSWTKLADVTITEAENSQDIGLFSKGSTESDVIGTVEFNGLSIENYRKTPFREISSEGVFRENLTGLQPNSSYRYQAQLQSENGTLYSGKLKGFMTRSEEDNSLSAEELIYYPMEGSTGKVEDNSGKGNSGTPEGNLVRNAEGYDGQSFRFDGESSYIDIGDAGDVGITDSFTVSTWIKTGYGDKRAIFSINTDTSGNRLLLFLRNGVLSLHDGSYNNAETKLDNGTWNHVTMTFERSTGRVRYFIDGKQEGNAFKAERKPQQSDILSIGQDYDGGSISDVFKGKMDSFRIYGEALSTEQVKKNYRRQTR